MNAMPEFLSFEEIIHPPLHRLHHHHRHRHHNHRNLTLDLEKNK
jgi:hypothetical protein